MPNWDIHGPCFGLKGTVGEGGGGLHIKSFCSQNEILDSFCKYGISIDKIIIFNIETHCNDV